MTVTSYNVKVGDKVVLNKNGRNNINTYEGKYTREIFSSVTHGIVMDVKPDKTYISVTFIDYKGRIVFYDWYIYKNHLDVYEG